MPDRSDVIGQAWQCTGCWHWTTVAAAMCCVCHRAQTAECPVDDPPCDHIWMHYEAGEDASATLSAPEGTTRWAEPVFVCTLCDLIQPEPVATA
jgi:hypothetical protein